ncbi:Membrane magnesium transporter 1 [Gonapodya sp. JEL0774]|nr:Membrane magnesium transporter 1 [Gonapodya sp. JEL0774]
MAAFLARIAIVLGLVLLAHSGYSGAEHIAFLKAVDRYESTFPIEIVVECLFGCFIAVVGIVATAGSLKPILLEAELAKTPYDKVDNNVSFRPMLHRRRPHT